MSLISRDTGELSMIANRNHHNPRMSRNQRPVYKLSDGAGLSDSDESTDGGYNNTQRKGKNVKRTTRRKQAVTKTRDRAVIAKIEQSRKTSPLLKLPTEVLQQILKYIVGGRLIHVEYLELGPCVARIASDDDSDDNSDDEVSPIHGADAGTSLSQDSNAAMPTVPEMVLPGTRTAGFRSSFCESQKSEREAFDEANAGYDSVPSNQDPDSYVASWKKRHADCYHWKGPGGFTLKAGHPERKVDLNVMGTCRELYEECNVLLWGTNTFSFDDPISFTKFLKSLNPSQKRKFANININVDVPMDDFYWPHEVSQIWWNALSSIHIRMLRGLTTLHLSVDLSWMHSGTFLNQVIRHSTSKERVFNSMAPIMRLEDLPLKDVTVIVADDPGSPGSAMQIPWTKAERLAFAETLRARFLADRTVEIQRRAEESREKREKERAARPNEAKRIRAYVRWRNQLAEEAQKRLRIQQEKVQALQEKACKFAAKAEGRKSKMLKQVAERAKGRVSDERHETADRQKKAKELKQQADEVVKDPSLAKKKPIAWSHLSDTSDAE